VKKRLKHTEDRVRALLRQHGPQTASFIGDQLWGRKGRKPQAFARPAGKLLQLLESQGLVRRLERGKLVLWEVMQKPEQNSAEVETRAEREHRIVARMEAFEVGLVPSADGSRLKADERVRSGGRLP